MSQTLIPTTLLQTLSESQQSLPSELDPNTGLPSVSLMRSQRWNNHLCARIMHLAPGQYALFAAGGRDLPPLSVGEWAQLEAAFTSRPLYLPPTRPTKVERQATATADIAALLGLT